MNPCAPLCPILVSQACEGHSAGGKKHCGGDHSEESGGQTETDRESDWGGGVFSGAEQTVSIHWQTCPSKHKFQQHCSLDELKQYYNIDI